MPKNKNKQFRLGIGSPGQPKDLRALKLVKIGDLARSFDILPSTINFYTREGLLPEDARSRGGYRLYHQERALERLRKIDLLQQRRMTIDEIKKQLR